MGRRLALLDFAVFAAIALACFAPIASHAQTTHNVTHAFLDDFICTDNASVSAGSPLASNPTNLETLRSWCANDARCAELYGQTGAPNLAVFSYLFQTTLAVPVASVFLETPLYDLLCNMTSEQFLMAGWVLMLINQNLDAGICDVNETPQLNPGGAGVTCVCQAGKICDSNNSSNLALGIIFIVAVVLAVVIQFGVVLWNRTRLAIPPSPGGGGGARPVVVAQAAAAAGASGGPPPPISAAPSASGARYRARGPHL